MFLNYSILVFFTAMYDVRRRIFLFLNRKMFSDGSGTEPAFFHKRRGIDGDVEIMPLAVIIMGR